MKEIKLEKFFTANFGEFKRKVYNILYHLIQENIYTSKALQDFTGKLKKFNIKKELK